MKRAKHINRALGVFLLISTLLLVCATLNVSAAKDIEMTVTRTSSSRIDAGGNFDVMVGIRNDEASDGDNITTDDDIDMEIYFNGVLVHKRTYNQFIPIGVTYNITINSRDF